MEDFQVKTIIVLAVMLVALSSFPLLSQSGPVDGRAVPIAAEAAKVASGIAAAASVSPAPTRPIDAKPVGKLDSKSAAFGNHAAHRVRSSRMTTDGTTIPTGLNPAGR